MNKPVILIGAGCSRELANRLLLQGIPVLVTWQGIDLVPENSGVFCGRPGVIGQRSANIIQQKADIVYIFGARMDAEQVAHRISNFAPKAKKIVFDVDPAELDKFPTGWTVIQQDLTHDFRLPYMELDADWLAWCKSLYRRFRPELDGADIVEDFVDPYFFTRILSEECEEGEIIVPGSSGTQSCVMMQAFKVKAGQRILLCNTTGAMGFEPMAIGAAVASGKRVICVTGDGGFFMNMQELEVVKRLNLPIKYFVFCNGGYGSITTMQDARFNMRVGGDESSGFTVLDLAYTAALFGFTYHKLDNNADMFKIKSILDGESPAIVRVNTTQAFRYVCKVNATLKDGIFEVDDMENMSPKLPISDLMELMR